MQVRGNDRQYVMGRNRRVRPEKRSWGSPTGTNVNLKVTLLDLESLAGGEDIIVVAKGTGDQSPQMRKVAIDAYLMSTKTRVYLLQEWVKYIVRA